LCLWAGGIDLLWFKNIMDEFERRTRHHYENALAQGRRMSGISAVKPWNLERVLMSQLIDEGQLPGFDPQTFRNYDVEAAFRTTLTNIGFDTTRLNIKVSRSDSMQYGGLCLGVQIPNDVRVALRPGRVPLSTLLHEFGHALHMSHVAVKEPILRGYETPGACTILWGEAMADCLAGFSGNDEWLKKVRLYKQEYIAARNQEFRKISSYRERWRLLDIDFELSAYENPDQDFDELYRKLYRRWFLIEYPTDEPTIWGANVMLATLPVYDPNYLLSHIVAWQIEQTMEEKFGKEVAFNKDVAGWMIENLYRMGESIPWKERLVRATGRSLDVKGYLRSEGY
jgi:hypothetical protein